MPGVTCQETSRNNNGSRKHPENGFLSNYFAKPKTKAISQHTGLTGSSLRDLSPEARRRLPRIYCAIKFKLSKRVRSTRPPPGRQTIKNPQILQHTTFPG